MNFRHRLVVAQLLLAATVNSFAQGQSDTSLHSLLEQCSLIENRADLPQSGDPLKTEADKSENSAESALADLCGSLVRREESSIQIARAADAVERLLDIGFVETARLIISAYSANVASQLSDELPSHLHFATAKARVLSFEDKNVEALQLRQELQPNLVRVFGELSPETVENRLRMANLRVELGELAAGLSEINELIVRSRDLLPSESRLLQLLRESQSIALAMSGNERDAIVKLRLLRDELATEHGTKDERVINIDEEIASVLLRQEKIEEAVRIECNVFLWRNEHLSPRSPKLLQTLWRLGYFLIVSERIETARAVLLYVRHQLINDDPTGSNRLLLQTMSRIASIEAKEGRFDTALELWRQVYEGERQLLGESATDTQLEASNYGVALLQSGKIDLACRLLLESLGIQERSHPNDVWSNALTQVSYDRCLLEKGDPASIQLAYQSLRTALVEIFEHFGGATPHSLYALATLAKAATILGKKNEAKRLLDEFVDLAEQFRNTAVYGVLGWESAFSSWVDGRSTIGDAFPGYRDLALIYAQDAELERALRISELARDRVLRDRFAEQEWRRTKLPNDARSQLADLVERIQGFDERIAVEANIIERIRLESERTLLVAERSRMERELRERLHLTRPAVRPPTLDDLRAVLRPNTALISVLHSGDSWWALVVLRDQPARFVEFGDPDLGRNASAWLRLLRGEPVRAWPLQGDRLAIDAIRPGDATGPYLTVDQLAQRLGNRLLVPLEKAVGKARRLVFVGDDELVGVPLQALPLRSGFGLDRFEISYAPSLTTYSQWQGRARTAAHNLDLLAIGGIDYKPIAPPATDDPIAIGVQVAQDHPLPFARTEIDAIAAQFPKERATEWTGTQANKAAVLRASRSGELRQYRYVHFAAHAWAQPNRPEASAIVLAARSPDDRPTQRALTATELAGLQMSSELLVLSACETGVGHFEHGQGLLGLAFAGLAAGNRAALLSLFPIADETTAIFMQHLYAKLRRGWNPVSALAATQREFRHSEDPKLATPAAWAPFILYGGY